MTYDSIACVKASIPVVAVIFGGIEIVRVGSHIATFGVNKSLPMLIFVISLLLVKTENIVSSLAVPEVVGTAIIGNGLFLTLFIPI